MSSKRVYWIEGDGIGPEIWRAARPVIDAALAKESDMRIEWVELSRAPIRIKYRQFPFR